MILFVIFNQCIFSPNFLSKHISRAPSSTLGTGLTTGMQWCHCMPCESEGAQSPPHESFQRCLRTVGRGVQTNQRKGKEVGFALHDRKHFTKMKLHSPDRWVHHMCKEETYFRLRWQQKSTAWCPVLVTEGHLKQESSGKTRPWNKHEEFEILY